MNRDGQNKKFSFFFLFFGVHINKKSAENRLAHCTVCVWTKTHTLCTDD